MGKKSNIEKGSVLVWVTNPDACQSIVDNGRILADNHGVELVIVSIQGSIKGDWKSYANDLTKLNQAAKSVNADLTVVYSDNKFEAAHKTIKQFKPIIMVAGLPASLGIGSFIEQIINMAPKVPVYSVDLTGNMVRIDSMTLRIS